MRRKASRAPPSRRCSTDRRLRVYARVPTRYRGALDVPRVPEGNHAHWSIDPEPWRSPRSHRSRAATRVRRVPDVRLRRPAQCRGADHLRRRLSVDTRPQARRGLLARVAFDAARQDGRVLRRRAARLDARPRRLPDDTQSAVVPVERLSDADRRAAGPVRHGPVARTVQVRVRRYAAGRSSSRGSRPIRLRGYSRANAGRRRCSRRSRAAVPATSATTSRSANTRAPRR